MKADSVLTMRHSAEHVLEQAMQNLYGKEKIVMAMGPAIDDGFYFDFRSVGLKISKDDFSRIEAEMQKIVKQDLPITAEDMSAGEAAKLFVHNPFKLELIEEIEASGELVSVYKTGNDFVDLCAGPHVPSTGKVGPFKLLSVAGAYWRGSEKNEMLTRIYGTAFPTKKELDDYLYRQEEAKKRDHRVLGPKLELFMFHETAPGSPYWLSKGLIMYNELLEYWRIEHRKRGYQEIASPLVNKKELWETSGHWEHFRDNMFIIEVDKGEVYGIKPMNCPNAMVVFGSQTRSYRDLPLRLSDADMLHRYEPSGTLNGLLRVRSFRQDDSHNFITEDQIESEVKEILDLCNQFYGIFEMKIRYRLSTRPEKFMGDVQTWHRAEKSLRKILDDLVGEKNYVEGAGEGAFYGPKIDILMEDVLGREWQMGTIQLDFQLPQRFSLHYIDKDGKEKTPVVIHRVIYGSVDRFIGILIEHYAGAFPVWLSPVQTVVIPIADRHTEYATKVAEELRKANIRVEVDSRQESMQAKIRDSQLQRTPVMLIIGDREMQAHTVAVRRRGGVDLGSHSYQETKDMIQRAVQKKHREVNE